MSNDLTLREEFEKTIHERLANPNLSALELKTLAEAYSELHKNDYMKDLLDKTSGFTGFGSPYPSTPPAQLENADKQFDI